MSGKSSVREKENKMNGCIHAFKEKTPADKCVWGCGITYGALAKAKEVDVRRLQFDDPKRKKRRRPFQSDTNWRDAMHSDALTKFEFVPLIKGMCPFCEKRLREFKSRSKSGYIERYALCKVCGKDTNKMECD